MSTPLWVTTTRGTTVGTATIAASTDVVTLAAHGLVAGQQVTVDTLTGGAASVLVADAPYYAATVTTNTFQLRPSPGAPVMLFAADGGCAVYQTAGLFDPQTLRDGFSGLLARGDGVGGFNARPGVFPNGSENAHVTTTGMNWTVADLVAAVRHSTGRMYTVPHPTEGGAVTAADPSQPRIDAIDLQIQDHALDASGFARGRIVYTAGTPGAVPVAPAAVTNAERLSTFTVAAAATSTGTPTTPRFTTARGGVIPAADTTAYPGTGGRYKGLVLYDMTLKSLVANTNAGSTWETVASANGFQYWQTVVFDASGTFTKASYPGLRAVRIRCQGAGGAGGGAVATTGSGASAGGGGQGGNYAEKWVLASALGTSETVTRGAGGTGASATDGNPGGTTSVGSLCSASGGAGGITVSSTSATWVAAISGTPVTTTTGDEPRQGDPGGFGRVNGTASFAEGGAGGGSRWGAGAQARQPGGGQNGFAGTLYGGGGGGGANWNTQATPRLGGAGANGRILIDLYL